MGKISVLSACNTIFLTPCTVANYEWKLIQNLDIKFLFCRVYHTENTNATLYVLAL